MIELLPVIDLMGGVVVRGVGGRREDYRPIESCLVDSAEPFAVAQTLVAHGCTQCYVADLDAIVQRQLSHDAIRAITEAGLSVWLDAGLGAGAPNWPALLTNELAAIIIGTETCWPFPSLARQLAIWGPRAVVSLDLKHDRLLGNWNNATPLELAQLAYNAGCRRFIVLDLAQVGIGAGISTLSLCQDLRAILPGIQLTSGGGVRHARDVQSLSKHGCDFALVASAIHDGSLALDGPSPA